MIEPQVERFHFLERIARPYVDEELSLSDINKLNNAMNQSLMAPGLSPGPRFFLGKEIFFSEPRLFFQIGYINAVRFAEGSDAIYWKNLFPFHEGGILNVPDIEQGIEEAKLFPSQINHKGQMSCLQYPWEESLWYDLSG